MAWAVPLSALVLVIACRRWVGRYWIDEGLERTVLATALWASVMGLVGTMSAVAGQFTPAVCGAGVLFVAGIIFVVSHRKDHPPPSPGAPRLVWSCVAIVAVGIALRWPSMDAALAGRDQGTYMLRADAMARTHTISTRAPALANAAARAHKRPGPADILGLFPTETDPDRAGVYEGAYRPGFYLAARDGGVIVPQFLHLFPSVLGMTRWSVPPTWSSAVNVAASGLWLLGCLAFALRWFRRPGPALTVGAILAVDPLAIWVGRTPLTEPLAALWWICAALCLQRAAGPRATRWMYLGAWFLGVAAWTRGNLWILAPILLSIPVALMPSSDTRPPAVHNARDRSMALGASLLLATMIVGSVAVHASTAFPYLFDEFGRLVPGVNLRPSTLTLGFAAVCAGALMTGMIARSVLRGDSMLRARERALRSLLRGSGVLILGCLLGRLVWTAAGWGPSLARIDLLVPALGVGTVGLVAIGTWTILRDRAPDPLAPATGWWVALVVAIAAQTTLFSRPVLPTSGLFYYGRYLLPQLLPLAVLLAVAGADRIAHWVHARVAARFQRTIKASQVHAGVYLGLIIAHALPLLQTPKLRLEEFSASRELIAALDATLPEDAILIAGGEGWLHAHTFNQVGGAIEIGTGRQVLPYRSREATYAAAMALLRPQAEPGSVPRVFMLLNEASRATPTGPRAREAVVDLTMPSPLTATVVATYELFDHRLQPSTGGLPSRVVRNEIRLSVIELRIREGASSTIWRASVAPSGPDSSAARYACTHTDRDSVFSFSMPAMDLAEASSPGWFSIGLTPEARVEARNLRVLDGGSDLPVRRKGERRQEQTTLGPWWRASPPTTVQISGSTRACADLVDTVRWSPEAPTGPRQTGVRDAPHHRFIPRVGERRGYGETDWTSAVVFNRHRIGARARVQTRADALELRAGVPVHFREMPVPHAPHRVALTLTHLDELAPDVAGTASVAITINGETAWTVALSERPPTPTWTYVFTSPTVPAGGPVTLTVTLHAPAPDTTLVLRDIALIEISGEPPSPSSRELR